VAQLSVFWIAVFPFSLSRLPSLQGHLSASPNRYSTSPGRKCCRQPPDSDFLQRPSLDAGSVFTDRPHSPFLLKTRFSLVCGLEFRRAAPLNQCLTIPYFPISFGQLSLSGHARKSLQLPRISRPKRFAASLSSDGVSPVRYLPVNNSFPPVPTSSLKTFRASHLLILCVFLRCFLGLFPEGFFDSGSPSAASLGDDKRLQRHASCRHTTSSLFGAAPHPAYPGTR